MFPIKTPKSESLKLHIKGGDEQRHCHCGKAASLPLHVELGKTAADATFLLSRNHSGLTSFPSQNLFPGSVSVPEKGSLTHIVLWLDGDNLVIRCFGF